MAEYEVKFSEVGGLQRFTMNHMQGPFYILAIGFALGICAVWIEKWAKRDRVETIIIA